jgi:hypothetical protein
MIYFISFIIFCALIFFRVTRYIIISIFCGMIFGYVFLFPMSEQYFMYYIATLIIIGLAAAIGSYEQA